MARILICRTCPRYETRRDPGVPTAGAGFAALAKRLAASTGDQVVVRTVNCLAGCKHPCNAAVEADGKYRLRFSRLTAADLEVLFAVSARHDMSVDGNLADTDLPDALRDRLSARSPAAIGD